MHMPAKQKLYRSFLPNILATRSFAPSSLYMYTSFVVSCFFLVYCFVRCRLYTTAPPRTTACCTGSHARMHYHHACLHLHLPAFCRRVYWRCQHTAHSVVRLGAHPTFTLRLLPATATTYTVCCTLHYLHCHCGRGSTHRYLPAHFPLFCAYRAVSLPFCVLPVCVRVCWFYLDHHWFSPSFPHCTPHWLYLRSPFISPFCTHYHWTLLPAFSCRALPARFVTAVHTCAHATHYAIPGCTVAFLPVLATTTLSCFLDVCLFYPTRPTYIWFVRFSLNSLHCTCLPAPPLPPFVKLCLYLFTASALPHRTC